MVNRTLRLTRAQISDIVNGDADAIRQFERLFATVDATPETTNTALALAELAATAPANPPLETLPVETLDWRRFPAFVSQEGRMGWQPYFGTLGLAVDGNVMVRMGLETLCPVVNASGGALDKGVFVRIVGASSSSRAEIAPFLADGSQSSLATVGLLSQPLADGAQGYATVYGVVEDVDTSAWAAGDQLYASATTAGGLTDTPPAALAVPVAVVLLVSSTEGKLLVRCHDKGGMRLAAVAPPAGGGTVDIEARTAINAIIDRLKQAGILT